MPRNMRNWREQNLHLSLVVYLFFVKSLQLFCKWSSVSVSKMVTPLFGIWCQSSLLRGICWSASLTTKIVQHFCVAIFRPRCYDILSKFRPKITSSYIDNRRSSFCLHIFVIPILSSFVSYFTFLYCCCGQINFQRFEYICYSTFSMFDKYFIINFNHPWPMAL